MMSEALRCASDRPFAMQATSNEKHAEIMEAALSKNVPLTLELMQEHVSLTQMEMKTSGDKDV